MHPIAALTLGCAAVGVVSWLAAAGNRRRAVGTADAAGRNALGPSLTGRAAQRLNHASTLLAGSVLFDSAVEHYRADFFSRAMPAPLLVSSAVLAASLHGISEAGPRSSVVRQGIGLVAAATGVAGLGFHAWNVMKREGSLSWDKLFYSAPVGAPFALTLAGVLGMAAEHVRDAHPVEPRLVGAAAGRALAVGTAGALMGTVAEAGLLHFRGAFQNPAMLLPVTMPPVAAAALVASALRPLGADHRPARIWLWATAGMGVAGVAFHAYGVARMMGGWSNWRQNMIDGPPLPAPPAFSGLALAGLAALDILAAERPGQGDREHRA